MTDDKPIASEQLELFTTDPEGFWLEVSRAISKKPWLHMWLRDSEEIYLGGATQQYRCHYCGDTKTCALRFLPDTDCPVPPKLTDPPEVIAAQLKDRFSAKQEMRYINVAEQLFTGCSMKDRRVAAGWICYAAAHPEDDVLCCLVALGDWDAEELPPVSKNEVCEWVDDDDGVFHGTCGIAWTFESGDTVANRVYYCPKCGRPVTRPLREKTEVDR